MDPDIAIFVYLIIFLFIYYVTYFLAKINMFSSIVLSLIIGLLAISILCPISLFDKTDENQCNNLAYLIIYGITIILVFLYIVIKVSQDIRR